MDPRDVGQLEPSWRSVNPLDLSFEICSSCAGVSVNTMDPGAAHPLTTMELEGEITATEEADRFPLMTTGVEIPKFTSMLPTEVQVPWKHTNSARG